MSQKNIDRKYKGFADWNEEMDAKFTKITSLLQIVDKRNYNSTAAMDRALDEAIISIMAKAHKALEA